MHTLVHLTDLSIPSHPAPQKPHTFNFISCSIYNPLAYLLHLPSKHHLAPFPPVPCPPSRASEGKLPSLTLYPPYNPRIPYCPYPPFCSSHPLLMLHHAAALDCGVCHCSGYEGRRIPLCKPLTHAAHKAACYPFPQTMLPFS